MQTSATNETARDTRFNAYSELCYLDKDEEETQVKFSSKLVLVLGLYGITRLHLCQLIPIIRKKIGICA